MMLNIQAAESSQTLMPPIHHHISSTSALHYITPRRAELGSASKLSTDGSRIEFRMTTCVLRALQVRPLRSMIYVRASAETGERNMGNDYACRFDNVSVACKANIYFDGKVISHSVEFADGTKKTLGLIYPGTYTFNTGAPERMEIIAGGCRAKLAGQSDWTTYNAGSAFDVPGESSFDIAVDEGIAEYVCSFGG